MPKIDMRQVGQRKGSGYPAPFHEKAKDRTQRALGDAGGLTDFGVNLVTLPPDNWSSQRHWHSAEDEFVYVLSGERTLITDAGEQSLAAGECAAFPKGVADGHHLINRGKADAVYLAIGTRSADDECRYPDIDLFAANGRFTRRDGTPYPPK